MLGKNDVKISLAYDVNRRYRYQENVSLLIEEFIHAIDDRLNPAFTETKAWQKAVGLDVTGYKKNKAAERLVNFNNKVQSKNNTVFRWFHEKHPHMYIEALVDVANIEFILFDKMLRDGNLTKLGFSPDDTVDTVMNEAFPNMWKLYRGVKPDQHMVQNQKGDVLTLNQEEKVVHPAGATLNGQEKNVVSFLSLCKHRAEGLTGQVVEVDPLPLPGNALAPDPKSRVRRPRRR